MQVFALLLTSVLSASDDPSFPVFKGSAEFDIASHASSSNSANNRSWTQVIEDNASVATSEPSLIDISDWLIGDDNMSNFDIGDSAETNEEMEQLKKQIAELKQEAEKHQAEKEALNLQLEKEKTQRKGIEERLFTILEETNQSGSASSSSAAAQINADAQSQEERHEEESTPEEEQYVISWETPESASSPTREEESTPEQEEYTLSWETPESAPSLTQIEDDEILAIQLQFELDHNTYAVREAIARKKLELLKESVQAIRNVVEEVKPHAEQVARNVTEEAKPHVEKAVRDVHRGAENAVKDIRRLFRF